MRTNSPRCTACTKARLPEKLAALRGFLAEFGLDLGGGDEPHAKDYATLLDKIKGRPDDACCRP